MNNIFSTKLYKEALRQLKVPASLFLGIMIGLSGITTVSFISDALSAYERSHYITTIQLSEALLFLPLIFAIAVPLFTFKLFGFLTKRNSSDFYHSVPYTRTCIYVSYSAAILSISAAFIFLGTLIPSIAYAAAGEFISYNVTYGIYYAINVFTCVVLCLGVLTLSSSLTGTFFTNIIFAIGIMFGPRIIITLVTEILTSAHSEILPYDAAFGIFSSNMNNIWSHVQALLLYEDFYEQNFTVSWSTLYTLGLGVLYILLGICAFNKRKSEQAESSAHNPISHNIIRCGIGFVFMMILVLLEYENDISSFAEISTLVFLSISGMTIFELITTRKVKRLIHVVISVPVVIILCIVLHFILYFAGNRIVAYEPDAASIKYIQFSPSSSMYELYDYFNYTSSKVKFDDKEIIEFLADAYNNHLDRYKAFMNDDSYDKYQYYDSFYHESTVITVRFNEGLTSKERNLYLTDEQLESFNKMISSNEAYLNAFRTLPDNLNVEYGGEYFNRAELKKIVAEYEKDLKAMDASMLSGKLSSETSITSDAIIVLEASTATNVGELCMGLRITPDTPNAYKATTDILTKKAESKEGKSLLKSIHKEATSFEKYNNEYGSLHLTIQVYDLESQTKIASMGFDEYLPSSFDYEDSFETGAYGSYKEFKDTMDKFLSNTATPADAKYVVFVSCDGSLTNEDYTDTEFVEYHSSFFTNDIDSIEYFRAEEYSQEYYGKDYEY